MVVLPYIYVFCSGLSSEPSTIAGDPRDLSFGGLPRFLGKGLSTLPASDPPPKGVIDVSFWALVTLRARPFGRFGGNCAALGFICVESSVGSGVAGCFPFPLVEARFLGVGRFVSEGLPCSPSLPSGGPDEQSLSMLVVVFALPFLRVSYLALHWTSRVGV